MSVEKIYICDNCKKEEKGELYDNKIVLPVKWINIERLKAWFNAKRGKGGVSNKFKIDIDEDEDPDFCSKECAIEWFTKQINKICK